MSDETRAGSEGGATSSGPVPIAESDGVDQTLCRLPSGPDLECRAPEGHDEGDHHWALTDSALLFRHGWSASSPTVRIDMPADRAEALRLLRGKASEAYTPQIEKFLLNRIAADEFVARSAYYEGQRWYAEEEVVGRYPDADAPAVMEAADRKCEALHIARWDPTRIIAECHAKRVMVEELARLGGVDAYSVLRAMAEIYREHPNYDPAWSMSDPVTSPAKADQ